MSKSMTDTLNGNAETVHIKYHYSFRYQYQQE